MFDKILIANRGEIACRVASTARRLGVRTVAVYSDADADSRHVAACNEARHLGGAAARDSYLRGDRVVAAARAAGAQAIHPGYGFLSENESFAQACADAGLVFIGPPPAAIAALGSKSMAKTLMQRAGVPLVPGYHGSRQEAGFLHEQADAIGYPVLIKASAGGGGKGMRVVGSGAEFGAQLDACRREALAAFGSDQVLVEQYLLHPRHIEIQVFADSHGHCVHLFERDCSVQRRHQKVVEEAPAPGLSAERRDAMGRAAVAVARAAGYVGAGTVEFIVAPDGAFYFMEMNTRLQVEHPVTEMITGLDLVEWQLRVAAGEALPLAQTDLAFHGHALEARVYAENPARGFLPSTGRLVHLAWPDAVEFDCGGRRDDANAASTSVPWSPPAPVRIDAAVRAGDTITPHYDPMIAKLVTWGADRAQALARMSAALADLHVVGVANNVDFLARLVANPAFAGGQLDTGLIERERAALFATVPADDAVLAAACARVLADEASAAGPDPWSDPSGWRLNLPSRRVIRLTEAGAAADATPVPHDVAIVYARGATSIELGGVAQPLAIHAALGNRLRIALGERIVTADIVAAGDELHVFADGRHWPLERIDAMAHAGEAAAEDGSLAAPMPGKVIALRSERGARVEKGAALMVIEAMKMEHTIVAPTDGTVDNFLYAVGDQVAEGAALVAFTPH